MPKGSGKTDVALAQGRARGAGGEPARHLHRARDRPLPVPVVLGHRPDRARLGVGGRVGPGVGRARQAVLGAVAVGHGAPHRVLGAERRLLPRARGLVHRPGAGHDRPHAAAAAGERGGAPLHRRSRSRPCAASRSACSGRGSSCGWRGSNAPAPGRTSPRSSSTRGSRAWTTRRAWDEPLAGHARDLERAPRATRRRHGLGQATPVDEGVPALPRHRRPRCAKRDGTPNPGGRQPVRGRGPGVHRDHGARRFRISPPSPRPPGRTEATSPASPPRHVPASPGCGTKQVGWYRAVRRARGQADRSAHREWARGDVRRRQPRPRPADGRGPEGVVERGEVLGAVVGPDGQVVRSHPLLAGTGVGARELAGRRRHEARGARRRRGGAAGRDPRPRRTGLHRVLRPARRHRHRRPRLLVERRAHARLAHEAGRRLRSHLVASSSSIVGTGRSSSCSNSSTVSMGRRFLRRRFRSCSATIGERDRGEIPLVLADEVGDVVQRRREPVAEVVDDGHLGEVPIAATRKNVRVRMRVAPAITLDEAVRAPRDQRVGEATEVVLDESRSPSSRGRACVPPSAARRLRSSDRRSSRAARGATGAPSASPKNTWADTSGWTSSMRVVLLLIASSVHGASVSSVGHTPWRPGRTRTPAPSARGTA